MYADHYKESSRSKNKSKSGKSKKIKKLSKLIASDSDTDADSEHELSYYMKDRVKLMKEVLKIMKPKRIKRMTPDCMKVRVFLIFSFTKGKELFFFCFSPIS